MNREKTETGSTRTGDSRVIRHNIGVMAEIERKALEDRSRSERLGDLVNQHAGRLWFVITHVVWFAVWIGLNVGILSAGERFDPFPFPLLTLVVSLEAIFLSLFILISQNRANRQADHRAHLDLQINLLTETEITKMMGMLQALCKANGLAEGDDPELQDLACQTEPQAVIQDLKQALPGE
ncbi:MAG: DUF1003 domain-containing protein [Acidobacteriota bacterium]